MNERLLVIDDSDESVVWEAMEREISSQLSISNHATTVRLEHVHLNPNDYFTEGDYTDVITKIKTVVTTYAQEYWDIILIDMNLYGAEAKDNDLVELPLSIAEVIREKNKSAVIIFYSGTAEDFINRVGKNEKNLRRLFAVNIPYIISRNNRKLLILRILQDRPIALLADRLLTENEMLYASNAIPEFNGISFGELAKSVRLQSDLGKRLTKLIVELGVASILDLSV